MDIFLLFIFGICVGSFLNVVIDRLPVGRSVITGRSACDYCHHPLAWYDLMPIFSFVLLQGKCRYCKKRLSWQYPLVEFITGILFVVVYLLSHVLLINTIDTVGFVLLLVIFSTLLVCFITDIKYGLLPNAVVGVGALAAFLYTLLLYPQHLLICLLAGVCALLFFVIIILITKGKGMGMGDGKLAFFMGLLLGFPAILLALYIAFLAGATVAIILVFFKKKKFKGGSIPFGPFLIAGTVVAFFWGPKLWQLVLKALGV